MTKAPTSSPNLRLGTPPPHVQNALHAVQELLDLRGYSFSPPRMIMSLMPPGDGDVAFLVH
jgi:hypothetical protein